MLADLPAAHAQGQLASGPQSSAAIASAAIELASRLPPPVARVLLRKQDGGEATVTLPRPLRSAGQCRNAPICV